MLAQCDQQVDSAFNERCRYEEATERLEAAMQIASDQVDTPVAGKRPSRYRHRITDPRTEPARWRR